MFFDDLEPQNKIIVLNEFSCERVDQATIKGFTENYTYRRKYPQGNLTLKEQILIVQTGICLSCSYPPNRKTHQPSSLIQKFQQTDIADPEIHCPGNYGKGHREKEHNKPKPICLWEPLSESIEGGSGWLYIRRWLNEFILSNRKSKIVLYVCGDTNLGKTLALIAPLQARLRTYSITHDDKQNMPWKNDYYDLCIIDDFDGQKTLAWLNGFTGSTSFDIR